MTPAIERLLSRGKERGYVTADEVNAALPDDGPEDLVVRVLCLLNDQGINPNISPVHAGGGYPAWDGRAACR